MVHNFVDHHKIKFCKNMENTSKIKEALGNEFPIKNERIVKNEFRFDAYEMKVKHLNILTKLVEKGMNLYIVERKKFVRVCFVF